MHLHQRFEISQLKGSMYDISFIAFLAQIQVSILIIFAIFGLTASGCTSKNSYTSQIDGNIFYNGMITKEGSDELLGILRKQKTKHFYINSIGGSSEEGLRIGEYVQINNISVTVAGRCYSSCANYIFLASKNRKVVIGSKIGLHGGYQSYHPRRLKLAAILPPDLGVDFQKSFKSEELKIAKEIQLLNNSGVDPEIINKSALMTYYGDVNYLANVNGEEKKFTLAKELNTNYELWFPSDYESSKLGVVFEYINSPFDKNALWQQMLSLTNDGIEINRAESFNFHERKNMDK
jgi:hypothetical protein